MPVSGFIRDGQPLPMRIQLGFPSYQVVNSHYLVGRKTRLDQGPRRNGLLIPDKEPNKVTVRYCDSFLNHSFRTLQEYWNPKQKHLHGVLLLFSLLK